MQKLAEHEVAVIEETGAVQFLVWHQDPFFFLFNGSCFTGCRRWLDSAFDQMARTRVGSEEEVVMMQIGEIDVGRQ